jgi:hypothetical protein
MPNLKKGGTDNLEITSLRLVVCPINFARFVVSTLVLEYLGTKVLTTSVFTPQI